MSRLLRLTLGVFLAATSAAACGPAVSLPPEAAKPPAPYRGTLSSGCAPNDAPSVLLRLHAVEGSNRVAFNMWPSLPVVPPTFIRFDASHPIGAASFCSAEDSCEAAEWGEVELTRSDQSAGVTGEWAIGLTGGRSLRGAFKAEWLAIQALCG
ncbi:MAG TPA: hypothetical protein VJK02_23840 [Anaerolineales bacterium]|nr:hypothetical protein [Anaerolineales bacterium]